MINKILKSRNRILINLLLFAFVHFAGTNAISQSLKDILLKAQNSKDSANYFFKQAERKLISDVDNAEFYLAKTAGGAGKFTTHTANEHGL